MIIKFKPREVEVSENPIFIVGECPRRPLKNQKSFNVWEGNQSPTLINQAIKGISNLYLTNIYNYYDSSNESKDDSITQGISDLIIDIKKYNPYKIICLGNFAFKIIDSMRLYETTIVKLPHPSWVFRFNKNKGCYIKALRSELS